MRLLTWNTQGELVLSNDLSDNIPPYAILSHTWGSDSDEVTFDEIQQHQGQDKAGYTKIRFCGEQARRDGINHFWVDTCCINKNNHVELSEAIVSMFRWYRDAKKCYVYLSDVPLRRADGVSDAQSIGELDLRASQWFARGWTLQELLAPAVVEFFSYEGNFLGTKQTLAHLIHEITTLPLAALHGTPLAQFSIDERIRWTEKRRTKKKEDEAYCLLGIFEVSMPLVYGEGDHAFRRLRKEINDHFGGNVAARLGHVGEVGSEGFRRKRASPIDLDDLVERASELDQEVQASQLAGLRPAKRVRSSCAANVSGKTTFDAPQMVTMGDHIQDPDQSSQSSVPITEEEFKTLRKSLLFDRIDFRVNNVKKAMLSTCQWLFRHPHFQTWHRNSSSDRHNGFLWIKGKPGCGKSTLMKAALEWVRRHAGKNHSRSTIIPYFFNARASASLEKSSLGLYRTVVHHLLSSYPQFRNLFAERFAWRAPGQSGEDWTVEELQDFLHEAVESNESFKLCLFIDALDEAEHEDDVRQMIKFLIELSDRASADDGSYRVQICLSSRHYPSISVGGSLSLVVEDQLEQGQDIETYITKHLTCLDGPGKDNLRAEILNKSARIFLWVVLVVEILNKLDDRGAPLSDMRARLETIPQDIHDLFKDILTKSDDGIDASILLFQWMSFRVRPLEPAELFVAMEYSRSPYDSTWVLPTEFCAPSPDRLARIILDCSRGLVEVVEVAPSQPAVVQFIHETVREFLLKENGLASIVPALAANLTGTSHEILRIACLRCISMNKLPKEYEHYCNASHNSKASLEIFKSEMRLKYPFLDYAVSHLFQHAEQAQQHEIPQQAFLASQTEENGLWSHFYRQWWNVLERYGTKKIKADVTLLYFLVERRHLNLALALPITSDIVDMVCGQYGGVLQAASKLGYEMVVQRLLNREANIEIPIANYRSALEKAATHNHEKTVRLLLDMGADIKTQEHYGSALCEASSRGCDRIVQILLDDGANINARGGYYGNALQAASLEGHEKVVKILLERGADVNAEGGNFGNALQAASSSGHEKVVKILLDRLADIDTRG